VKWWTQFDLVKQNGSGIYLHRTKGKTMSPFLTRIKLLSKWSVKKQKCRTIKDTLISPFFFSQLKKENFLNSNRKTLYSHQMVKL
jgi:hypothetical protein